METAAPVDIIPNFLRILTKHILQYGTYKHDSKIYVLTLNKQQCVIHIQTNTKTGKRQISIRDRRYGEMKYETDLQENITRYGSNITIPYLQTSFFYFTEEQIYMNATGELPIMNEIKWVPRTFYQTTIPEVERSKYPYMWQPSIIEEKEGDEKPFYNYRYFKDEPQFEEEEKTNDKIGKKILLIISNHLDIPDRYPCIIEVEGFPLDITMIRTGSFTGCVFELVECKIFLGLQGEF